MLNRQATCSKNSNRILAEITKLNFDIEVTVFIFFVKLCLCIEIPYCYLGLGKDINFAVYTAEKPHILVFEICTVAVSVDFGCDKVLAGYKVLGDIELGRSH